MNLVEGWRIGHDIAGFQHRSKRTSPATKKVVACKMRRSVQRLAFRLVRAQVLTNR